MGEEFSGSRGSNGQLTPEQLGDLTRQMVEATDPVVAAALKEKIIRGFYGDEPHS